MALAALAETPALAVQGSYESFVNFFFSGASPNPAEVGRGGDGGDGGIGSSGGRGQDGANGFSQSLFSSVAITNPGNIPNVAATVTITEIGYCTNSEVELTKNLGNWGFSNSVIVNDVSFTTSTFNNASSPIRIFFTTIGQKDVVLNSVALIGYVSISKFDFFCFFYCFF